MFRTQLPPLLAAWGGFLALAGCVSAAPASPQKTPSRGVEVLPQKHVQPPPVFDPRQSAGLFVGIRQFKTAEANTALPLVQYAADDAVDLAYLFAMELGLIEPGNVRLLLSGEPVKETSKQELQALLDSKMPPYLPADRSTILRHLHLQSQNVGQDGLLIVSFATHGIYQNGTYLLLTADSVEPVFAETSISFSDVIGRVEDARTRRRIVLFDTCREVVRPGARGPFPDPRFAKSPESADEIARSTGEVILSAALTGGYAYDDDQRRNGVFTAAVLDGLRCHATPDARGWITGTSLALFVKEQVAEWIKKNKPDVPDWLRGIQHTDASVGDGLAIRHCPSPNPKESLTLRDPISKPPVEVTDERCKDVQLESIEIRSGSKELHTIFPNNLELSLQLEHLAASQNLSGRAFLSHDGKRIDGCRCRWERFDSASTSWVELGQEGSSCTFSLEEIPREKSDVALRLVLREDSSLLIILHLQ